jgi:hypothetical protein
MKSNAPEYKGIIKKLLEKTRQGKVDWEQTSYMGQFQCTLASADTESFAFTVFSDEGRLALRMRDHDSNTIFLARSNDLPTSPEEEEVSQMIEDIYDLARRQALKIDYKLEQAAALLDRA